ncbi:MAG: PTS sugar transporter subunit IIA [Planctomycetaceae bacterium]
MRHETLSLQELAEYLGRDQRELQKLADRGRIPCRRVGGEWQFHSSEIAHWLESEMRHYSDGELAAVEQSQQSTELDHALPVCSLISPETIAVPLEARTRRSVLESLVEVAGRTWKIWEPSAVLQAVLAREELMSTAFDNGVAIPHPRQPLPDAIGEPVIAFGRTPNGIPFGAADNSLSDLFFLVVCKDSRTHLHVLARLGRLLQTPGFLDALRTAPDSQSAYSVIAAADKTIG